MKPRVMELNLRGKATGTACKAKTAWFIRV